MRRPDPPPIPLRADDPTTLTAFLDFYRAALLDRAHGLSSEQLQVSLAPSSLTLSRMLGHSDGQHRSTTSAREPTSPAATGVFDGYWST